MALSPKIVQPFTFIEGLRSLKCNIVLCRLYTQLHTKKEAQESIPPAKMGIDSWAS
jgi:hypothetical protein